MVKCVACGFEMPEGLHYLEVEIKTKTVMPDGYVPPNPIDFPPEIAGPFCSPAHLLEAILDSPELKSTFGR